MSLWSIGHLRKEHLIKTNTRVLLDRVRFSVLARLLIRNDEMTEMERYFMSNC